MGALDYLLLAIVAVCAVLAWRAWRKSGRCGGDCSCCGRSCKK